MNIIKKEKSLYWKMLGMNVIPLFLLALVITSFSAGSVANAINGEAKKGLMDLSSTILTIYDYLYPGDYSVTEYADALYMFKGDKQINGDFSVIDTIKEKTGADITFFYQDIRVITTLYNDNNERILGSKVNAVVTRDVLQTGKPAFYPSVSIDGKQYFAYYSPIFNSDGSCIGMLFVARPTTSVNESIRSVIFPIIGIGVIAIIIAGLFTVRFSNSLIHAITQIEEFLRKVAKGNLNDNLDYAVSRREDELGEMGRYAVTMQKALIELIEKDALTGLYNRRYGAKRLNKVYKNKFVRNIDFCLAIGDIDHFKHVNDTYGHDCGDVVLLEVSRIMRAAMKGRGFVARWGGEEFLLVFEGMTFSDSAAKLEEILNEIREREIIYEDEGKKETLRVTMTFGICQGSLESVDSVLKEADNKLYHGKNNGRNQIVQ